MYNLEENIAREAEANKILVYNECRLKSMKKILCEYNYEDLLKNGEDLLLEFIPNSKEDEFKEWIGNRKSYYKQRYKYIMFTINFNEGCPYTLIKKKTKKAVKKKWIMNYEYQYECRNFIDNNWTGVHVHIVCEIDEDKNAYECKREMYNTFKDCIGNKKHINVRYSNRDNAFVEYVRGFTFALDVLHIFI